MSAFLVTPLLGSLITDNPRRNMSYFSFLLVGRSCRNKKNSFGVTEHGETCR